MKQNRSMNIARILLATLYGILIITSLVTNPGNPSLPEKVTVMQNVNSKDSTSVIYFARHANK